MKEDKELQKDGEKIFTQIKHTNSITTMLDNYYKHLEIYAKLKKHKYDQLMKNGFTKEQSLEIIIKTDIFK